MAAHTDGYLKHGIGIFSIDLPGTGESLHAAAEVGSDRIFSAALDYLARRPDVDAARKVVTEHLMAETDGTLRENAADVLEAFGRGKRLV